MSKTPRIPPELSDLDAALGRIRFRPRASLGPEVIGRLRRGERSKGAAPLRGRRPSLWAIAAGLLIAVTSAGWLAERARGITVDHCCYDFDGGGPADDGVLVVSTGGDAVRRITVYEDRDGSRSLTPADVVRFDRGSRLALAAATAEGAITARHCCSDLDGGGPPDDGLLVVTIPPDQVRLVGLYERKPDSSSTQLLLR
jgi:hypothetical protein